MECRRVLVGTTLREPPDAGHASQRWTMNGSSFGALAYADTRVVWRDPLLKWVLLLPMGLALLLRVVIPKAQAALLVSAGFEAAPYYPLVMGGYLMTAPGIVGMVVGFLLLDEQDARTLTALRVTPLSMRRYLAYRVTLPVLVGTASTLIGYPLIGFSAVYFVVGHRDRGRGRVARTGTAGGA